MFALTQVTARLADELTWGGLLRGLLLLAAIWWAWAAYAWLTNEVDTRRTTVRAAIFVAMVGMLLSSLAIPAAFEGDALLFACAYLVVRVTHIGLFAAGSDDIGVRQAAHALALTALLAPALLLIATLLDGTAQVLVWMVALALDYAGGGLRGIEGWRLSPGHFAERHGLIVIIALGESIVAIGVGAGEIELGGGELVAAGLGVILAAALWWLYFDDAPTRVEHRLHGAPQADRNRLARDGYSFLHLPLVSGIVLSALGLKKTLEHVGDPLATIAAVGLCGGVALYLVADVAFRARGLGVLERPRLVAAVVCLALLPLATQATALAGLAGVVAVAAALATYEALRAQRVEHPAGLRPTDAEAL